MFHHTAFLTSEVEYVTGQLHASTALPPGKNSPHLLNKRLCGPQDRSGCGR